MTINIGTPDRVLRITIAAVLVLVAFGTAALDVVMFYWLALAVAGVFTLTSLVGNYPLDAIVGLKTCSDC